MRKKLVGIIIAISIFSLLIYSLSGKIFETKFLKQTKVTVASVIDGDTIELPNGKKVRLLGIDAPERGQHYYEEAKEKLRELIERREIVLENDVTNTDKSGRLLRYVFVDDLFVNLEMVKKGYANVYIVEPDVKYEKELIQAENEAREKGLGIWEISALPYSNCIEIVNFHWNAKGKDNENLNDEYVIFKNNCNFPIDLASWSIKDRSANFYIFPEFELKSKEEVVLRSGSGKNTEKELYWNSKRAIWDNNGDTLYLRDGDGNLVLVHSYGY